ncbi:MAG: efflux RND transporter periplasmic adaptor subunit [Gammaproteobacteria bacterium]
MKKPMLIMLISVGILFAAIFSFHAFQKIMIRRQMAHNQAPAITVSAMKVKYSWWQPQLTFAASTRAIRGVNVTTELAGMVRTIYLKPGATVKEGDVLVQLNADTDIAQLHSLQATAELAKITYLRNQAQYAIHAVSKETLDTNIGDLKSQQAQVAEQAATVIKKTIRAPFTGRLGISLVNPGQFLNPGDAIVTLQTQDPIYVDFFVPQQQLVNLSVGQPVTVTADTYPGQIFNGKISTINPLVDVNTRNVEVEATISNPKYELVPGMFASANVNIGAQQAYLTLPQTVVSFNSYGEIIYLVQESGKDSKGNPILTAHQTFVTTGNTRGDQIAILQGLKVGETVVTSGQLKLKNGSRVIINNSVVPSNDPAPIITNE